MWIYVKEASVLVLRRCAVPPPFVGRVRPTIDVRARDELAQMLEDKPVMAPGPVVAPAWLQR